MRVEQLPRPTLNLLKRREFVHARGTDLEVRQETPLVHGWPKGGQHTRRVEGVLRGRRGTIPAPRTWRFQGTLTGLPM